MNRFLQLHFLTSYGPSNLNRDDQGRPKTAKFGNGIRLRVSSQSLKRAWRTSDVFEAAVGAHQGKRTKRIGREAYDALSAAGVKDKDAFDWARLIAGAFGAVEKLEEKKKAAAKVKEGEVAVVIEPKDPLKALLNTTMTFIAPSERAGVDALVALLVQEKREPKPEELHFLRKDIAAVDIALFGRMLADDAGFNIDAACQVAHAITVHTAEIDDDYFSAVDDLNPKESTGSGHIGEQGFGAGVFYSYICVDRQLLLDNLRGDRKLMDQTLRALAECAATVAPSGKQNSFASRAYASYGLAEVGDAQPRQLSMAFLKPVADQDVLRDAILRLTETYERLDAVYGKSAAARASFDALSGTGSLRLMCDLAVQE